MMQRLSEHLYRFEDTCHVYVVCCGEQAVLIDFGNGAVLNQLKDIGVERVSAVLITHHHRDQSSGLAEAATQGIPIWVPHTEQDLFHSVDLHLRGREIMNSYNNRQDRFSFLEPIPITNTLRDYRSYTFSGQSFEVVPTPGHTTGSLTLLSEVDGQRVAFTGDLIAAPGKLWSLAATQWSYNGAEGVAMTVASLLDLKDRRPDLLLPSHGEVMSDLRAAIDPLTERLWRLLYHRKQNPRLFRLRERPYENLTPHLLRNRTALAFSYVLLSQSKKALFIDFGYDFIAGVAAGSDRASRRPWLYTLPALKRDYGVQAIEVVVPTHFHDDHVAGINLLREVEGTKVWAAETFFDVIENPYRHNLPCLWYGPIPVDRVLPVEFPVQWEEYSFTLYPQPGHTRHAVAIAFDVDGKRVLAIGDQYQYGGQAQWNYVYNNGFDIDDYRKSAALYRNLQPDLILSGHWDPYWVEPGYFDTLTERGETLYEFHRELLLPEALPHGDIGYNFTIEPYQLSGRGGERIGLEVRVRNPLPHPEVATVKLVVPEGWCVEPAVREVQLRAGASATLTFHVVPKPRSVWRARIAAELTLGKRPLGQQADAFVNVS